MSAASASGVKPRRLRPSALMPCGAQGCPATVTYGGMSCSTTEETPAITCAPTFTNWCTPVKPPSTVWSPIQTWPARVALLAKTVWSPTTQSCAMWQ